jgi:hypothetical protein
VPLFVPPSGVGSCSMLQSCGSSTRRHAESSKPGAWAPDGSPSAKRHPAPKSVVVRALATPHQAPIAMIASTIERTAIPPGHCDSSRRSIPCAGLYPFGFESAPFEGESYARPSSQSRTETW